MGTLQVLLFLPRSLPSFRGWRDVFRKIIGSPAEVVDITRFDEALVVGAALSLSSSAFVLKIMQEKGSALWWVTTLGILLLQDIAVVPLLVLLPIIENSKGPCQSNSRRLCWAPPSSKPSSAWAAFSWWEGK